MPITKDKSGQFRFEFNRIIANRRIRTSKLLPRGWSSRQADDYDKKETARIYALASGQNRQATIEQAVLIYLKERAPQLKTFKAISLELANNYYLYANKLIDELPIVANDIKNLDLSEASKRNYIAVIRAACRYAWRYHKLGDHDPAQHVSMPRVNNARQVYASRKQMLAIARCSSYLIRPYIRIAFYSGMRLGEILRAEISDNCFVLKDTKNSNPRLVPIHPKLNSAIKCLKRNVPKSTIQNYFRAGRKLAKLEHVQFRDLRHSAASEMINAEVDLYTVGGVLGHKDSRSTQRYAHLATKTLKLAIAKIGNK
jgi:integrase